MNFVVQQHFVWSNELAISLYIVDLPIYIYIYISIRFTAQTEKNIIIPKIENIPKEYL